MEMDHQPMMADHALVMLVDQPMAMDHQPAMRRHGLMIADHQPDDPGSPAW
jgi:hypothetical protein